MPELSANPAPAPIGQPPEGRIQRLGPAPQIPVTCTLLVTQSPPFCSKPAWK